MAEARIPEAVDRWELTGGTWRIVEVGVSSATVELRRCDGGEVADVIRLTEPEEIDWAQQSAEDVTES